MELLSPAGNREALVAAIACGADAVYLGYTAFGARSYAGNFDADGLRDAVAYAHERGKKIYVTVNTLVKQCELDDLRDVLDLLSDVRVDAADGVYENLIDRSAVTVKNGILFCTGEPVILRAEG